LPEKKNDKKKNGGVKEQPNSDPFFFFSQEGKEKAHHGFPSQKKITPTGVTAKRMHIV